jgi:VanZ family protein
VATTLLLPVVLVITLWAGLHPFSWARRNDVQWLGLEGGLRLGSASMALTAADLSWDTTSGPARLGWELWLTPAGPTETAKAIVVLADEARMPALLLSQTGVDIVVAARVTNEDGERWYNDFVFPQVLVDQRRIHLRLASGSPRPHLYLDGREIAASSGFGIPLARQGARLQGPILVGCTPRADGSWRGELHGMVLYERGPTASDLAQRNGPLPRSVEEAALLPGVLAAYAFREGRGDRVADLSGRGPALRVPKYYRPVRAQPFAFPPPPSSLGLPLALDAVVNLLGLIPFGYLLALVLLARLRRRWFLIVVLTTAAGALVSFGIESLQVLMPSRDSSLLDFVLNTLGTMLGAGLAVWVSTRRGTPGPVPRENSLPPTPTSGASVSAP